MRIRWIPLGWGLGVGAGLVLAAVLGAYLPSWGVAMGVPGAALLFAAGAVLSPDDALPGWVLRLTVAVVIGFLAFGIPIVENRLAGPDAGTELRQLLDTATAAEARTELHLRWATLAATIPIGLVALTLRHRRRSPPRD